MCANTATAFAWIGAILINIAFATLISWSTLLYGFVITLLYAIVLFVLARLIERREIDISPNNNIPPTFAESSSSISVLVSLLYGVAVIALGVSGFMLSLKIYNCPPHSIYDNYYDSKVVVTNRSSFPGDVRDWYDSESGRIYGAAATFGHFPSPEDTLVYQGSNGSHFTKYGSPTTRLWKKVGSRPPELMSEFYYPREFTLIGNATNNGGIGNTTTTSYCFFAIRRVNSTERDDDEYVTEEDTVAYTDGSTVKAARDEYPGARDALGASDGRLYFRADQLPSQERNEGSVSHYFYGKFIFSLDAGTMDVTSHSRITVEGSDGIKRPASCDYRGVERRRAVLSIVTSVVPVITASVWYGARKRITTMPITLYVGLSALTVAIIIVVTPNYSTVAPKVLKYWFATTSAVWLCALILLRLTNRIKRDMLAWSLNFCGLVYFISLLVLINVPFSSYTDDAWRWLLINIVNFIPLIVIGVITEFILLVVLGAIGLFMDAWKIGNLIVDRVGGDFLVYFFVFSITGMGMGYFGWLLNWHQTRIQHAVSDWAGMWLHCLVKGEEQIHQSTHQRPWNGDITVTAEDTMPDEIETGAELWELEMRQNRPID
mmetsp:Transcript_60584/g.71955  ORF Transcript_60584/g.71955 Transcript_60584/m.71955 type:complete len:603 (+) Transcript_60584:241-2049(+)